MPYRPQQGYLWLAMSFLGEILRKTRPMVIATFSQLAATAIAEGWPWQAPRPETIRDLANSLGVAEDSPEGFGYDRATTLAASAQNLKEPPDVCWKDANPLELKPMSSRAYIERLGVIAISTSRRGRDGFLHVSIRDPGNLA